MSKVKKIDLALQGGGAHGAYTWGVIDRLLDDDRIEIDGVSGTSAGAMNGVCTIYGLKKGGKKKGTRERKGRKKRLFHHFFWVSWHLRHRLQDLFSSELQRMAFFCFLSRCQKSDVQMQRREKMLRFYFKFFPPLSFLLLFPHLELLSPF